MSVKDVHDSLTVQALAGSFQSEEDLFDVDDEGSILSEALEEEISKILREEDSDNEEPLKVERIDIQEKDWRTMMPESLALEIFGRAKELTSFKNQ